MKTYEYTQVYASDNTTNRLIDDINEMGKEGWRLITHTTSDGGGWESALLERELPPTAHH